VKPTLDQLTLFLQKAVADHFFSGASLLLFYRGEIIFQQEVGETTWPIQGLDPRKVDCKSLFDLASLTKPLATLFLTALFIQERKLSLDDPIGNLLEPSLPQEKKETTIRALLNHSSGFPDWKPFYQEYDPVKISVAGLLEQEGKHLICKKVHEVPYVYPPGSRSLYSDLGYILLGEILEALGGESLDRLFIRYIAGRLGIHDLGYRPLELFGPERTCVATEMSEWRGRILQGEVDDDNAYAMGGVAGHAGLFGTARAVYTCFSEWRKGFWNKSHLLSAPVVKACADRERFPSDWGLGWMFPSVSSSAGKFFSKQSFGHLGFTGTSLWFDPVVDLGVIFLTNRVHPTRENHALHDFRPLLHDLIYNGVIHEKT
jgi:CubicO group peptidase (beta-lactamase class C family)